MGRWVGNASQSREKGWKTRRGQGSWYFHLRTASRNGGKIAHVNYITTAASRERSRSQVAIVFVGMLLER
jgi:hypothetical protein